MTGHPAHETAEIINPDSAFPVLFTCEHAGNKLPPDVMPYLGMDYTFLDSYHGYDIGIPHLARRVSSHLGATCILGVYSRLLIDLNREPYAHDVLHGHDDGIIIPANQDFSDKQLEERLDKYHAPFHEICAYHVDRLLEHYRNPVIFSFHSFPRHQTGYEYPFPWNFTLHYRESFGLSDIFLDFFAANYPEIHLGDNEPYDLSKPGASGALFMHGEKRGLPNLLVGIPNDQLLDPEGIDYWTGICIEVLCAVPEKIGVAPRHMVYGNTD